MHDAITIGDYCYRNKHEPMLLLHFDGRYLCGVNFKSIVYESIDHYFRLPGIGVCFNCH